MIDLLNNIGFLFLLLSIVTSLISMYLFFRASELKQYLQETLKLSERLDSECEELKEKDTDNKRTIMALRDLLKKSELLNNVLRTQMDSLSTENNSLCAQLAKANVAAMPVRKPRRPRNRKPQSNNGQA